MLITLAVVAYNEEEHLPALIEDIKGQIYPHDQIELFFIDSASKDHTKALMEEFSEKNDKEDSFGFRRVWVSDNPKRIQSAGWNVAIDEFLSESEPTQALVRVDAHARIPKDFVSSCVFALGEDDLTGEKADETFDKDIENVKEYVVGGARPTICDLDGAWSRTLWMAEESMFGSSPSAARRPDEAVKSDDSEDERKKTSEPLSKRTYVKSLFHACYRREVLEKAGGFREDLGRTEDNEFHYRIRKLGYKIYRSPDIYSEQYVRPSLGRMIRQKAGNGYWVGRTLGFVPGCISVYHLVPLAFLLAIIATSVLAVCGWPLGIELLGSMYLSVAVLMAIYSALRLQLQREWVPVSAILLPLIFFCLHVCYGAGTFLGIISIPFGRKR